MSPLGVSAGKMRGIVEERAEDVRVASNGDGSGLASWRARVNRPARHAYG